MFYTWDMKMNFAHENNLNTNVAYAISTYEKHITVFVKLTMFSKLMTPEWDLSENYHGREDMLFYQTKMKNF